MSGRGRQAGKAAFAFLLRLDGAFFGRLGGEIGGGEDRAVDREPASLDFAVIGHAADWAGALGLVQVLRSPDLPPLEQRDLSELYPWIPPRAVAKIRVRRSPEESGLTGAYIDTFILDRQG